jgi:hypothetical protein
MSDWIISFAIFTGSAAADRAGNESRKKMGRTKRTERNGMSPNVTDGQRQGEERKKPKKKDGKITSEDWRRIRHHPIQLVAAH